MCNTYLVYMTMTIVVQPLSPCSEQHNSPCTVSFAVPSNPPKDARTATAHCGSVGVWEEPTGANHVPGCPLLGSCISSCTPQSARSFPHLVLPFLLFAQRQFNPARPWSRAQQPVISQPALHPVLSKAQVPRCPAAQVHRPGAAMYLGTTCLHAMYRRFLSSPASAVGVSGLQHVVSHLHGTQTCPLTPSVW